MTSIDWCDQSLAFVCDVSSTYCLLAVMVSRCPCLCSPKDYAKDVEVQCLVVERLASSVYFMATCVMGVLHVCSKL